MAEPYLADDNLTPAWLDSLLWGCPENWPGQVTPPPPHPTPWALECFRETVLEVAVTPGGQ